MTRLPRQKKGGTSGETIEFYVAGVLATTYVFQIGGITNLDLAIIDTQQGLPDDANADGLVNALDVTAVERIISGLDTRTTGADANQDGSVNALDITKVERIIAGLD